MAYIDDKSEIMTDWPTHSQYQLQGDAIASKNINIDTTTDGNIQIKIFRVMVVILREALASDKWSYHHHSWGEFLCICHSVRGITVIIIIIIIICFI